MHKRYLLLIIIILTIVSISDGQRKLSNHIALTGGTIFDGTGTIIDNGIIIIKNGKIEAIGDKGLDIPRKCEVIDVTGKYITPGLVDSHIHFAQTGFFDGRPDVVDIRDTINFDQLQTDLKNNPDSYYEAYLRSGVTAVYDVGGFRWTLERQESAEQNPNAPHVAASGPLLCGLPEYSLAIYNTKEGKQMIHLSSPEFGRQIVRELSDMGSTGIKIWGLQLEDTSFMNSLRAVADETILQNNKLIVHATTLDQAKEALRLGARVLVHSVDDLEVDDEFIELAKENEVIYLPTLTVVRGYLNTFKSLKELRTVSDPNDAMDTRAKSYVAFSTAFYSFYESHDYFDERMEGFEKMINAVELQTAINLKKIYQAGIRIAVATDAGNPGTFHGISIYDEMDAMQKAGIPAKDIIVMATKNGAIAMDRIEDFGTLQAGKVADLIILREDPSTDISNMRSITHVMRAGNLRSVSEKF